MHSNPGSLIYLVTRAGQFSQDAQVLVTTACNIDYTGNCFHDIHYLPKLCAYRFKHSLLNACYIRGCDEYVVTFEPKCTSSDGYYKKSQVSSYSVTT